MHTSGQRETMWQYTSWQLKCPGEDNHQKARHRSGWGGKVEEEETGRGEEVGGTRGWGKLK